MDVSLLLETTSFAAAKHRDQRRKDVFQTPYIQHPIDVARRLAAPTSSLHPSPPIEILQAALLHDTVEDTETSPEELERVFGAKVAKIVMECTDDKTKGKQARKQAQVDSAAKKSWEAQNVKLADKLSNLTDLSQSVPVGWTVERVQEYFGWAKTVTDQIKDANPGLGQQLQELYDHAEFKHEGKTHKCLP